MPSDGSLQGGQEKRALVPEDKEERQGPEMPLGVCARGRFSKAGRRNWIWGGPVGTTRRLGELPGELKARFVARRFRLLQGAHHLLVPPMLLQRQELSRGDLYLT
jgi:hypothetical protein